LESQLRRIYEIARSRDELAEQIRHLADSLEDQRQQFETTQRRMQGLIQSRFDESVRQVFRQISTELPATLAELDHSMDRSIVAFLDAKGAQYRRSIDADGRIQLDISPQSDAEPALQEGGQFVIGHARDLGDRSPIHLSHPLLVAALTEARLSAGQARRIRIRLEDDRIDLRQLRGGRGRIVLVRLQHQGFEPFDQILPIMMLDSNDEPLPSETAIALLEQQLCEESEVAGPSAISDSAVTEAIDALLFDHQVELGPIEQQRFEKALGQLERYVEDQTLVLRREHHLIQERFQESQRRREGILAPEARDRLDQQLRGLEESLENLDERIATLERREDEDYLRWRHVAHDRRYAEPEVEWLADAEFVIA
jgi:hypothetical protein